MGERRLDADPARWPAPLAHLLTGDVGPALGTVLGPGGGPIASWRPTQVTHRPARSTTVQYRVRSAAPSGRLVTSVVVLAHGDDGPTTLVSGGQRLRGWSIAGDPGLPGLARALDPARVSSLLDLVGNPVGPPALRRRAYRPGRRAVVEVTGPLGRAFLKVVPPDRAAPLVDIHRRSGRTLPVPRVLGCSADGVVVLSALAGRTLRSALTGVAADDAEQVDQLPDLPAIEAHLDRLPGASSAHGPGRPREPLRTLRRHVGLLGVVLPDVAVQLAELVDEVERRLVTHHRPVPVHGDLYESQLMVTRGRSPRICGLLDLDTVGSGHRVDDVANLCAHLSTLALRTSNSHPPTPLGDPSTPVGRYLGAVFASAEERHDPVDLRARTAARVIGMATGPFRVQEEAWPTATARRIDLAGAWLDSATP